MVLTSRHEIDPVHVWPRRASSMYSQPLDPHVLKKTNTRSAPYFDGSRTRRGRGVRISCVRTYSTETPEGSSSNVTGGVAGPVEGSQPAGRTNMAVIAQATKRFPTFASMG